MFGLNSRNTLWVQLDKKQAHFENDTTPTQRDSRNTLWVQLDKKTVF